MDAERWAAVQRVFHEALALPRDLHDQFLARACGADPELRHEVESLLDAHFADRDFLQTPAIETAADSTVEVGKKIGDYEIIERLGAGGMGDVLLARQETSAFVRKVAIKIVKRGMDTDEVLRRFTLERRILATLVHTNIAQLYDAGATDDGRPYFVMEYVDGRRIDDWVETEALSTHERLRLFRSICHAVQYAHQNLVVHRDIKPGNVLVSSEGTPKLVDFGIGKILSHTDDFGDAPTRTHQAVLTPDYAAPEQLRGEPVTTATDVYALGALLYELLTGERPWADKKIGNAERTRRTSEKPPTRPSDVAAQSKRLDMAERPQRMRELRGDLDDIVLKAMRNEPERRYRTAAALADDIDRHLEGLPVEARGDSRFYRAGKFLHRNAGTVTAAAVFVVGLLVVTATTVVQSERVARERDKALEVQRFLLETFGATTAEGTAGDSVSVRQLLDGQSAIVETAYDDDPVLEAEMFAVLGDAYERLGLYDDAERLARRALQARQALYRKAHPDVAASLNLLGWIRHQQGASEEGADLLAQAVAMLRSIGDRDAAALARALNDLGAVYDQLGRGDDAERLLRESLAIRTRDGDVTGPGVAVTSNNLAVLLHRRGDYAGADEFGQAALDALRASVGPDHQRTFVAQSNLATFRWVAGDPEGAAALLEDLLDRQTRIDGGRNARTAAAMVTYASLLRVQDRMEEAERMLREALAIQNEVLDPNHRSIGNTLRVLGVVLQRTNRNEEAIPLFRKNLEINRMAYGEEHIQVAEALYSLAFSHEIAGNLDIAGAHALEAVTTFEHTAGAEHPRTAAARELHRNILDRLSVAGRGELDAVVSD